MVDTGARRGALGCRTGERAGGSASAHSAPARAGVRRCWLGSPCSPIRGKRQAVAADLPFLTNFPLVYALGNRGAYEMAFAALDQLSATQQPDAWRALGYIDTLSHAHRLTMPVLLTAGSVDQVTPKNSIHSCFDRLPGTRSFTELAGQDHGYTVPFMPLATAWFGM